MERCNPGPGEALGVVVEALLEATELVESDLLDEGALPEPALHADALDDAVLRRESLFQGIVKIDTESARVFTMIVDDLGE